MIDVNLILITWPQKHAKTISNGKSTVVRYSWIIRKLKLQRFWQRLLLDKIIEWQSQHVSFNSFLRFSEKCKIFVMSREMYRKWMSSEFEKTLRYRHRHYLNFQLHYSLAALNVFYGFSKFLFEHLFIDFTDLLLMKTSIKRNRRVLQYQIVRSLSIKIFCCKSQQNCKLFFITLCHNFIDTFKENKRNNGIKSFKLFRIDWNLFFVATSNPSSLFSL